MSKYLTFFVGFLLVAMLVQAEDAMAPHMELVQDDIVGVTLHPDGVTPVADLPIRVWSQSKQKMIYRTKTNQDGIFEIPDKMGNDDCCIFVGRLRIDLKMYVAEQNSVHQHHDIVIVVPRVMALPSAPNVTEVVLSPALLGVPFVSQPAAVVAPALSTLPDLVFTPTLVVVPPEQIVVSP